MDEKSLKQTAWRSAMYRLLQRRAANDIRPQAGIDDYAKHLERALLSGVLRDGDSVLDVGCGSGILALLLERMNWRGTYTGLDPFLDETIANTVKRSTSGGITACFINGQIEDAEFERHTFDAALCFAVLDGVEDLALTLKALNHCVDRSIIILTGLNIPVDDCHTYKLTLDELTNGLREFYLHKNYTLYDDGERKVELLFLERRPHADKKA